MDPYQVTFDTWNKVADIYQEKFMDLELYKDTYETFCNELQVQQARILDVGCGPGNITKQLLSIQPDLYILGIDVAPNMVELAKQNNPTADFRVMDCRALDMFHQEFDGIICGFCIPYLSEKDLHKLARDCYAALDQAGVFYCSFIEGEHADSGYDTGSTGDQVFVYYYSEQQVRNALQEAGFNNLLSVRKEYPVTGHKTSGHLIMIAHRG